jgi:hypothetical protein
MPQATPVAPSKKMKKSVLLSRRRGRASRLAMGDGDANPITDRENKKDSAATDLVHHRGTLVEG